MSISPNVPSPQDSYRYETPAASGTPRWIAALFGVLFVALAALGYVGHSAQSKLEGDLSKSQEQSKILSAQLEQANARLADLKGQVEVASQKIGMTQSEIAEARSRAESIRKAQTASDQKLSQEIVDAQKQSDEKIGAVSTDLTGAKKDIESTRSDLETTKGKLDRATGDMGVMSGLIARNHDDLEDLRRKGDRNYYEFTLQKSKTPQRVGPVQMALNKTDQKKSKYTVTVLADDKSIEKKDKTAGEPVQFYVKGAARQFPYEIVVFDVGKNQINGYLATPKEGGAPASSTQSAPPAASAPAAAPTAAPASKP
jgi:DNA-binding CsgD family transcriptional regulator